MIGSWTVLYNAKIEKLKLCGCGDEGNLIININDIKLNGYYQAPDEWILKFLTINGTVIKSRVFNEYEVNAEIQIDLKVVYGNYNLIDQKIKSYPDNLEISGGDFRGEIVKSNSEDSFLIDCGFLIDIENESKTGLFKIGDYIKTSGTYQVYFPDTEYSFD